MIGVSEEQKVQTKGSLGELYSTLLSLYGRVLRVRTQEEIYDDYMYLHGYERGPSQAVNYNSRDSVGRIVALNLHRSYQIAKPVRFQDAHLQHNSLEIVIEGGEKIAVELNSSELSILQEDTGAWRVIHRSEGWEEFGQEGAEA